MDTSEKPKLNLDPPSFDYYTYDGVPFNEKMEVCRAWIRRYARPGKRLNVRWPVGVLKHVVERWVDEARIRPEHLHIDKANFVAAMMLEGYRANIDYDFYFRPNVPCDTRAQWTVQFAATFKVDKKYYPEGENARSAATRCRAIGCGHGFLEHRQQLARVCKVPDCLCTGWR